MRAVALADILGAMEAEAEAEIKRTEEQSAATVAQIRAAVENDAHAVREGHRRDMSIRVEQERARRLNRARLAALRTSSGAREKLYAEALAGARALLAALRADPKYPAMLRALAEEALAHMDGQTVLHADPRDEQLLRALFPGTRMEFDLDTWGGVEARGPDGLIVIVNTVEARLERAQELLRQAVMPLFKG